MKDQCSCLSFRHCPDADDVRQYSCVSECVCVGASECDGKSSEALKFSAVCKSFCAACWSNKKAAFELTE